MRMCGRCSNAGAPGGAGRAGARGGAASSVGQCGGVGLGLGGKIEEMALVGVVGASLAAGAEDVAAEQGQGLGELGVLLLEVVVIGGGLREDALQLVDAAVLVLGRRAVLGLLPQRVVVCGAGRRGAAGTRPDHRGVAVPCP